MLVFMIRRLKLFGVYAAIFVCPPAAGVSQSCDRVGYSGPATHSAHNRGKPNRQIQAKEGAQQTHRGIQEMDSPARGVLAAKRESTGQLGCLGAASSIPSRLERPARSLKSFLASMREEGERPCNAVMVDWRRVAVTVRAWA